MAIPWNSIDPQWAWSPYEPTREAPWNTARAAHLFRRAAFGADSAQLQEAVQLSPQEVVARLFATPPSLESFDQQSKDLANFALATSDIDRLAAWWIHRMLYSPYPLQERMTLFWHGHFATGNDKVADVELMYQQNRMLRKHALGNFADMVHEISRDPAMLIYLDSATNRRAHPNENYARELMELFTLGEGNYTEQDVQQLARCFTGWEVRRKQFRFNPYQNDQGEKTLFGQRRAFTGDEAIDLVLAQPQVAVFIVRKWFRYFFADEPPAPAEALIPLVEQFRKEQLNITNVLRRMLSSQLFFSPWVMGQKVRSPIDFLVTTVRSLRAATNVQLVAEHSGKLGQKLFVPPNVKGWEGGRAWINSATVVGRANAARQIVFHSTTRFDDRELVDVARSHAGEQPEKWVDWLAELLLAIPLHPAARKELVDVAQSSNSPGNLREVLYLMMTMPEYQLA